MNFQSNSKPNGWALWPLLVFLGVFFGAGLYFTAHGEAMGFYTLRAPVAILPALVLAAWIARRRGVDATERLLAGMGESNVMLMCLIFLLAGAFAAVTQAVGAVDAVVGLALGHLPAGWVLPGLFLIAGFVSLAIGSSMGTLAAVVPIALGVADATGLPVSLVVASVIGGAMFGDNLSVVSDTTIAATRTQGAEMRDKFRENVKIALPAALVVVVLLAVLGRGQAEVDLPPSASAWLVLPYLVVLGMAIAGVNVLVVLGTGIVLAAGFGVIFAGDGYDVVRWASDIYSGFENMVEITLLSILIGGLAELTRASGGLAWVSAKVARFARGHAGQRSGEASIAALSTVTDVFTANNTVAILISGSLARDIAERHGVTARRAASVLDIFSCVTQGLIPWGAQILLAASLAKLSPLELAGQVYYCWVLGVVALVFIAMPRRSIPNAAREMSASTSAK